MTPTEKQVWLVIGYFHGSGKAMTGHV